MNEKIINRINNEELTEEELEKVSGGVHLGGILSDVDKAEQLQEYMEQLASSGKLNESKEMIAANFVIGGYNQYAQEKFTQEYVDNIAQQMKHDFGKK